MTMRKIVSIFVLMAVAIAPAVAQNAETPDRYGMRIEQYNISWSKVIETDIPVERLAELAERKLATTRQNDTVVVGRVENHRILNAHRMFTLSTNVVMFDVRYQFRDGRYKVDVWNIKWKSLISYSNALFRVESTWRDISEVFYKSSGRLAKENTIDLYCTELSMTFEALCTLEQPLSQPSMAEDNDW